MREAVADDWPAIAELHAASWSSAYRGIMSDAYLDGPVEHERRAVWEARFAEPVDPDQVVILAEDGGGLLGFCCIPAGRDPRWGSLIDNLHVRPGLSRCRIGRRVLHEAACRIPDVHATAPLHLTVLEANARARAAYESWGGALAERLHSLEPDGSRLPVRRYAWRSPTDLIARLGGEPTNP